MDADEDAVLGRDGRLDFLDPNDIGGPVRVPDGRLHGFLLVVGRHAA
jgi:hypothetical protein